MQKSSEGGQLTLFDLDTLFGKMCPAPSPVENPRAKTSGASWKKSSKLKYAAYQSLDLTPGAGNLLGRILLGDAFSLAWRCLDAQYWGVAQRRKRIFLVADFGGSTAEEILFK